MKSLSNKNRDILDKAKGIFIQEVKSRLPEALHSMSVLKDKGHDKESADTLYRFAHTLKGSGRMVNLADIAEPATEMCVAIELMKNYGVNLQEGIISFLEERINEIIYELDNYRNISKAAVSKIQQSNTKKKIFVIDDEPSVSNFIKSALESSGYDVKVYNNTLKAEEELYIESPDLIVLDIVMSSEEEGIIFCRKIRADYNLKLIPIIFLSKKSELRDKLEGFETGADDYLCKPFEMEELEARIQALLKRQETQKNLILQDDLTGIYNRRYLEQRLMEEIAKSDRTNGCFSVAMIDIDYFKAVNDQYGHTAGDEILQLFVEKLQENLRTSDVICRYGGEEFVIIFPDTPKDHAYKVLERLRSIVSVYPIKLSEVNTKIKITFSGGISSYPKDGAEGNKLMATADYAMYRAKETGRNKIVLFEGDILIGKEDISSR